LFFAYFGLIIICTQPWTYCWPYLEYDRVHRQ